MEIEDLARVYRVKTEGELQRLKLESHQLTPEAREQLNRELGRRGINIAQGVDDPHRDTRPETGNRKGSDRFYALFPSLRRLFATLRDWKQYKRQTGAWPAASIGFYMVHGIFLLGWAGSFIWLAVVHEWSRTKTILIIMPLLLLDVLLEDWLQGKIRVVELRNHRRKRDTQNANTVNSKSR